MALAEKDAIPTELFGAHGTSVNLVDIFNAAVQALDAEFHFGRSDEFAAKNAKHTTKIAE